MVNDSRSPLSATLFCFPVDLVSRPRGQDQCRPWTKARRSAGNSLAHSAAAPVPRAALVAEAVRLGAGDDADELLDGLLTDGLLVAG